MKKTKTRMLFEKLCADDNTYDGITKTLTEGKLINYVYVVSELKDLTREQVVETVKCMSNIVTSDNFLLSKLLERDEFPIAMCNNFSETFSTCNKCFYYLVLGKIDRCLYNLSIYKIPYNVGLNRILRKFEVSPSTSRQIFFCCLPRESKQRRDGTLVQKITPPNG